ISFILPLKHPYLSTKLTPPLQSIPLTIPTHKIPTPLLQILHQPIPPPSPNITPPPSPTTFQHLNTHLNPKLNPILNPHQSQQPLQTTVIHSTHFPFPIAPPPSITQHIIQTKLPHSINPQIYEENQNPIPPRIKYKHYSPHTPLTILKDLNKKIPN
ncbi:Sua5/YciO/YrdC/YwlC family protein, partial [Staphylococcus epidermidis]|uniref:Sua5/YciO/YrdC/YwlC family protein n=1 Tax=Staphylococcus epidermidis TaxID=1282 RepID=UPI0016433FCE